jgi:hypothetical protein
MATGSAAEFLFELPPACLDACRCGLAAGGSVLPPQACQDPPEALRREVFPWLDDWLERYRLASSSGATFAEGGLDNDPDLSGEVFLRLLSVLRDVFL